MRPPLLSLSIRPPKLRPRPRPRLYALPLRTTTPSTSTQPPPSLSDTQTLRHPDTPHSVRTTHAPNLAPSLARTRPTHDAKEYTHFPRTLRDRDRPESQALVPLPRLRRRHRRARNPTPLPPPSSTTRPDRHKASHSPQDARTSARIEHRLPPARRSPVSIRQTPACARNRFGESSFSPAYLPSPSLEPFAHGLCLGWQRGAVGLWPFDANGQ